MTPLPFIPFTNCAEWVMRGNLSGQAAYITGAVQAAAALTPTDLLQIANDVAEWFTTDLNDFVHNLYTVDDVKVTDLTTQSSPVYIGGSGLPDAGNLTGAIVPNNVALVISFTTVLRGRSYRGRNYVPAMAAANLSTSTTFTSTIAGDVANSFTNLHTALASDGFIPVILSRFNNGVRRTTGVAQPITGIIGRTAVGTQRRRVIGHGI